jgi:ribosomal protein L11 methyltransferase
VKLRAYFDDARPIPSIGTIESRLAAIDADRAPIRILGVTGIEDGRWVERWVAALAPFNVGRRFVVEPIEDLPQMEGSASAPRAESRGRMTLRICPSRAFGTGEHPTTRLCLEELESVDLAGRTVLDAGTGSGILAIAARRLGALGTVAFDNDPEAIEVARANARLNPEAAPILFLAGEPAAIPPGLFDVVVANLNGTILERVLGDLARRLAPRGHLILSGLVEEEIDSIASLAKDLGARPVRITKLDGWACLHHEARCA